MTVIFMVAYCLVNAPASVPKDYLCKPVPSSPTFSTIEDCNKWKEPFDRGAHPNLDVFCIKKEVSDWQRAN